MTAYRQQRLADQLRAELSRIVLREMRDPRVGFATLTEVRLSSDLRHARVYVSVMGDDEEKEATLEALESAEGFLRGRIGQRMRLRHIPELAFVLDETLDRSERIERLLEADKEDREEGPDEEGAREDEETPDDEETPGEAETPDEERLDG